jgi:hypothetical protein
LVAEARESSGGDVNPIRPFIVTADRVNFKKAIERIITTPYFNPPSNKQL